MKLIVFLLASSAYAANVYFKTKPPDGEYLVPSYVRDSHPFEPVYLTKMDGAEVVIKCSVLKFDGRAACSCGLTVKVAFQSDSVIRCPPKKGLLDGLLQKELNDCRLHVEEKGFVDAVLSLVKVYGMDALAKGDIGLELLKKGRSYPCSTSLQASVSPIHLEHSAHFPLLALSNPIHGLYSIPTWHIKPPRWATPITSLKVPGIPEMRANCQTQSSAGKLTCHCLIQWTKAVFPSDIHVLVCPPTKENFIKPIDSAFPTLVDCNVELDDTFERKFDRLQKKHSKKDLTSSGIAMSTRGWPCHAVVTTKSVAPFKPPSSFDPDTLFDFERVVLPSDYEVLDDDSHHLITRHDSKGDVDTGESKSHILTFDDKGVKYTGPSDKDPFALF